MGKKSEEGEAEADDYSGGGRFGKLGAIRRYLTVILCIAIAASGAAAGYFYIQNASAGSQAATLTADLTSLQTNYSTLQTSNTNMQLSYTALQSSLSTLQSNDSGLQTSITLLRDQYDSLSTQYTALNSIYSSLQSNYSALQQNYSQLMASYTSLESLVPQGKGIVIDSIQSTKIVNSTNAEIISVSVRNLGPTDVHVCSMKLYYNNILQSSESFDQDIPGDNLAMTLSTSLQPITYNSNYVYTLVVQTQEGFNATIGPLQM